MKNYNGSHLSPSSNSSTIKLTSTTPLSNSAKTPASAEETFTLKDLKQEYTKALSFIDKLKAEQNSIKNHLRMALDQKAQPSSPDLSYSPRSQPTQVTKKNVTRDSDKRVVELEIENSELRSQIDTAMVRLSKLQREKQTLQDKLIESETNIPSHRGPTSELRSLNQEIRTLKARLQEAEEENTRLLRQKGYDRASQKPSQNLMRYINYVSKLVSSMPSASFVRSCYEERFPRSSDVYELLESGQNEAVLLKSYKYITDLLINLNSLSTEESTLRVQETASEPISQIPSKYGSRRNSPTSARDNREGFSKRLQPPQEGFRPQRLQFETLETISTAKTPSREEDGGYTGNEGSQSSEYEHSKRNLQKIIGGIEENKGYKKPQKKHARHASSIIGAYKSTHDSIGIEGSLAESGVGSRVYWDSRIGIGGVGSPVEEYNYSVKTRRLRNEGDSKAIEEEVPESCPALKVRPMKVERHAREGEVEDDVREDAKGPRYREREQRNNREKYQEEDEEDMYRSEFVKARVAEGTKNDKEERREGKREEENERRLSDNYGYIKKRTRDSKEEDSRKEYKTQDVARKERNKEIRTSRSRSSDNEENVEEKSKREPYYKAQNNKGKGGEMASRGAERKVESYYRSRSMPKDDEIIEETQESEKATDTRPENIRRQHNNTKRPYEEKEDDEEDIHERNEIWDRKREELTRASKKMNVSVNTSTDLKGKDFSTFSVSFGRTESKRKVSGSPDAKTAANIMDMPRKKRVDPLSVNYDLITGKDKKPFTPQATKREERSPTVRFADEEVDSKKLKKKNSSMANLKKIVGDTEHTD